MHYPKPFYRAQRDSWEVQVDGKRTTLAKGKENEAEAWRAYHRLMASQGKEVPEDKITVALACDFFMDHARKSITPAACEQYRIKLQDFIARYGRMKAAALRPSHVSDWIRSHSWSDSTKRGAITAVKTCLSWCVKEGRLAANPLKDVKRPRMGRRDRTVNPGERQAIRDAIEGPLLDYLDALTWTGARPGEIMRLEATHIDWDEGVARMAGKTTEVTGEPIAFVLVAPMLAMCRRLADLHPEGPLFRNADGNPWTPNAIRCRMRRLREKLKIKGVTAYTFRHSFATDALERGVPVTDVAALMNHRDIRTTMGYSHLKERREHLKRQAEKATGKVKPEGAG